MVATAVPDVRRLAQYRPFERGGLDLRAVLQDLVLAAAAINDGHLDSIFDCQRAFADCWGLDVEIDELRAVTGGLIEGKRIEKVGKGIRLAPEVASEFAARAREWDHIDERALREWELAVRRMRPEVSAEDMTLLRSDLRGWIHQIFIRHGAEAALMLYPEDERARRFFDEVDAHGFEQLPEREVDLRALREQALPLFIRNATPDQRRFLAGLLNTSFYMCVLTIDPSAKNLVQEQMKGHRIYLDTNFLYAVLGAAPPEEVYSARRLVKLCQDLGFELAMTPWTVSELRTSITRSRRQIDRQREFIRPELAETMLHVSGEKGFNRLFWQAYNDKGTRPKDVFDRLEHFDDELRSYGIDETAQGCTAIEQQEEQIRAYAGLLNSERWPEQKEWVVLEHDAKCRLLVERLRGSGNLRLSNARFWFLTYDGKLPRFANRVPDNGDQVPDVPFCVSPSALIQILRALAPRTEDYERTVVDLLTSPFVGYRRAVDPAIVQEVVGRMDHFEDASPEMALAVLMDTAKVREIEQALASEDEDTVEESVRTAYSAKARELEEAVAASQQRAARAEQAHADAQARIAEIEIARARDREEDEEAKRKREEEWRREREGLHEQISQATSARDEAHRAADERIQKIEDRLEGDTKRRRRNRRAIAGAALILLGLTIAIVLPLVVVSGKWAIGGAIVGGLGAILLGTRILTGPRLGGEVALWSGLLVGIAGIVVAIASNWH